MNPEIKTKWIEALRSGKYRQVMGVLKRGQGYCCLGVLREIVRPGDTSSLGNDGQMLTDEFLGACGWGWSGACVPTTLASRNDDGEHTFAQLADYIEKNL
jgi:hypothetical protein